MNGEKTINKGNALKQGLKNVVVLNNWKLEKILNVFSVLKRVQRKCACHFSFFPVLRVTYQHKQQKINKTQM
jgi:hypothetical protein